MTKRPHLAGVAALAASGAPVALAATKTSKRGGANTVWCFDVSNYGFVTGNGKYKSF